MNQTFTALWLAWIAMFVVIGIGGAWLVVHIAVPGAV